MSAIFSEASSSRIISLTTSRSSPVPISVNKITLVPSGWVKVTSKSLAHELRVEKKQRERWCEVCRASKFWLNYHKDVDLLFQTNQNVHIVNGTAIRIPSNSESDARRARCPTLGYGYGICWRSTHYELIW